MSLPLDHVVIAVSNLAHAMADYRSLGFQVLEGGRHSARESHNALIVFADGAYLELIAWQADNQERWYKLLQTDGEGLVDFALLPHDTMAVLGAAQARGLTSLHGPVDGGRTRPDGQVLQWRSARSHTADLPFLCGDITPRHWRVPEDPALCVHANGALGVAGIRVLVRDLATTLARYQALLGPDSDIRRVDDGDGIDRAQIGLVGCALELISPSAEGNNSTPSLAPAWRQRLANRGEGPCQLRLYATQASALRSDLCHGADISLGLNAP